MPDGVATYRARLDEVPGWFGAEDFWLFDFFLSQQAQEPPGDLLEMGPYLGRSAILLGLHRRDGERVTVCDLFGVPADDAANAFEVGGYSNLTREAFERNYRRFVGRLPEIVQAPTSALAGALPDGGHRFVHVDASHLYEHVRDDLRVAAALVRPGGVVACDDFRSPHTPGTAAAVWEAVLGGLLEPVCVSNQKLYAVTAAGADWRRKLLDALASAGLAAELDVVAGTELIRVRRASERLVPTRRDRLERRVLPGAVKAHVDRRRLERWMAEWAREQPVIGAEIAGLTGVDVLAPGPRRRRPGTARRVIARFVRVGKRRRAVPPCDDRLPAKDTDG